MRNRKPFCIWKKLNQYHIGSYYKTDCNKMKGDNDYDILKDAKYKFCPYCGGKIIPESLYKELDSI